MVRRIDLARHVMIAAMVEVKPMTGEWAEALAEGDSVFEERFGPRVETGWAVAETLPFLLSYHSRGQPQQWGAHLFFVDGVLVGNGGWKGPPVDGVAEIGYAVAPARQGRGVATAAVRYFIAQARSERLRMVVAHTLPSPSASTTVLQRCGFSKVAVVEGQGESTLWRWELPLPADGAGNLGSER